MKAALFRLLVFAMAAGAHINSNSLACN